MPQQGMAEKKNRKTLTFPPQGAAFHAAALARIDGLPQHCAKRLPIEPPQKENDWPGEGEAIHAQNHTLELQVGCPG